jgi:hypothetical protein
MESTIFELIFRILLAVAVFVSLLYFILRFFLCCRWYSIYSEIKKFTSYQYILPIKIEDDFDAKKTNYIRLMNFLLKIQYALWIATFIGMMVVAIIGGLKF